MDWPNLIKTASARVTPYIRQTPVVTFETRAVTQPVTLKLEQLQHAGSFKTRGAFNTLLGTEPPAAGLVAASGGNHGAAVAYAAQRLGFPARVYVPEIAGLPDAYLFSPWEAPADILSAAGVTLGQTYPRPIVDVKRSRLDALAAFAALKESA